MISNTCVSAPPERGCRGSRSLSNRTRQGRGAGRATSTCFLRPPEQAGEPQPPDDPERLEADPEGELGGPARAVEEEERHLLDARAVPLEPIVHLDLERVAIRADPIEGDPLEQLATDAAEASGGIADPEAGHL